MTKRKKAPASVDPKEFAQSHPVESLARIAIGFALDAIQKHPRAADPLNLVKRLSALPNFHADPVKWQSELNRLADVLGSESVNAKSSPDDVELAIARRVVWNASAATVGANDLGRLRNIALAFLHAGMILGTSGGIAGVNVVRDRFLAEHARRAANKRHSNEKRLKLVADVRDHWEEWQRDRPRYKNGAAFDRKMQETYKDQITTPATVFNWRKKWEAERMEARSLEKVQR